MFRVYVTMFFFVCVRHCMAVMRLLIQEQILITEAIGELIFPQLGVSNLVYVEIQKP